jgi:2-methylisocitrate lyase-like PEP mutase family enzyme
MTTFADLHDGPLPLLLPNAWDVPSALAFVAEGYPAVGTTSFGVASALGRPDGSRATREANLRLADQLRPLPVFLTVDIEDGYSDDPDEVASYVAGLDVDGINIEDSIAGRLVDPAAVAAKVAAIKARNPDVFVNARVDSYWVHEDETVEAAVARGTAYVEAGANGVFLPGLSDPDPLREITGSLGVPVNVLAIPGRTLAELADLGVRRVSTGSLPYRAALTAAVRAAAAIRDGDEPPPAAGYHALQERLTSHVEGKGEARAGGTDRR